MCAIQKAAQASHEVKVTTAPIPATFGSTETVTFDAGGLQVSSVVFPARLRLRPHWHERHCISIVLDGWLATVQTIPADVLHEDTFAARPTRSLILEAEVEAAERLGAYGIDLDEVRYLRDPGAAALALRIARELDALDAASPLVIEGLVLELLARVARSNHGERASSRSPVWLAKARQQVEDRFDAPFSVAAIAASVGVHPSHLAREFKRHYGTSIGAYVRRLRLEWATGRLAASDDSLSSIAFAAGFANQSHFTRAFKSHTGLTPGGYRASARG